MLSLKNVFYFVGLSLLIHSGFSSFELHRLEMLDVDYTTESALIKSGIPTETIIALMFILSGALYSIRNNSKLSIEKKEIKPLYTYLNSIFVKDVMQEQEVLGFSEFQLYETRLPFIDIKKKRKEYSEWINK